MAAFPLRGSIPDNMMPPLTVYLAAARTYPGLALDEVDSNLLLEALLLAVLDEEL